MNSSSLFSEGLAFFKRTIPLNIPNPYQASQSQKSDSSSTTQKFSGNGTSSGSLSQLNKNQASHSAQNDKDIDDYKSLVGENKIKENATCLGHEYKEPGPKDLIDDNHKMLTDIVDGNISTESTNYKRTNGDSENTMLQHHQNIQNISKSFVKQDSVGKKHKPPEIHPDLTIDQIQNPRPVQRRKSCFVVGNPEKPNIAGDALEINTMFDAPKSWEKNSTSSKASNNNKRKTRSRRQSFIVIANDASNQNTNLILMEVPTTRNRRKSMPFLNTVILDGDNTFIENLPESIIVDEVDVTIEDVTVESVPAADIDENMRMDIDPTTSHELYNESCKEFDNDTETIDDDALNKVKEIASDEQKLPIRFEPTKTMDTETIMEVSEYSNDDINTIDESVGSIRDNPLCIENPHISIPQNDAFLEASVPDPSPIQTYHNNVLDNPTADLNPSEPFPSPRKNVQFSRQKSKPLFKRQSTVGNEPSYIGKSISPPCIKITGISSPEDTNPLLETPSSSNYDIKEEDSDARSPPLSPTPFKPPEPIHKSPPSSTRRRPAFGRQVSLDHRAHIPTKKKPPMIQRQTTLGGPPPMIRITDVDSESDECETNTTLTFAPEPDVEMDTSNEISSDKSLSPMRSDYACHTKQEDSNTFLAPDRKRSSFRRQGSLEQKSRRSVMIIRQKSLDNRSSGGLHDMPSHSPVISIRQNSPLGHPMGKSQPLILEFGKGFDKVSHESTLSRINSVASDVSLSRMNSVMDPDDVAMMENEEKEMENLKTFLQTAKRAPVLSRQRSLDQRSRRAAGMVKQKSLDQRMHPTGGQMSRTDSVHLSPGCSRNGSLATTPEGTVPTFETSFDGSTARKTTDSRPTSPYGSPIPDASMEVASNVEEHDASRRESLVRQNSGLLIINAASSVQAQQNIGNFLFPTRKTAMMTRQRSLDVRPTTTTTHETRRSRRPSLCRITRQKSLDQRHSSSRPQSRKSSNQSGNGSVSSGGEHSGPSSRRQSSKISIGPNSNSSISTGTSSSAFSSNYSSTSATHGSLSTTTDSQSRRTSSAYGVPGSLSHSRRSSSTRGSSSYLPRQVSVTSTSSDMFDSRRSSASYGSFASRTCSELRRCSSTDTWSSSSSCLNRSR